MSTLYVLIQCRIVGGIRGLVCCFFLCGSRSSFLEKLSSALQAACISEKIVEPARWSTCCPGVSSHLACQSSSLSPHNPLQHHLGDLFVVLLEMHEVRIALDANLAQLDPLRISSNLLEVVHNAVIVCSVHTGLCGYHNIRHRSDVRELARRFDLLHTLAQCGCCVANSLSDEFGWAGKSWFVIQRCSGEAVGFVRNAAGADSVPREWGRACLKVNAGSHVLRTVIREQDIGCTASGVSDQVCRSDELE